MNKKDKERAEAKYILRTARLQDDLRYELDGGIHTYHQCKCGRAATRAGKCGMCLMEEFYRWKDKRCQKQS